MAICWERPLPLAFHLCCFYFSVVLVVRVPFPIGVWGRMWNSIVSVPDLCLFVYLTQYQYFRIEVICKFHIQRFVNEQYKVSQLRASHTIRYTYSFQMGFPVTFILISGKARKKQSQFLCTGLDFPLYTNFLTN